MMRSAIWRVENLVSHKVLFTHLKPSRALSTNATKNRSCNRHPLVLLETCWHRRIAGSSFSFKPILQCTGRTFTTPTSKTNSLEKIATQLPHCDSHPYINHPNEHIRIRARSSWVGKPIATPLISLVSNIHQNKFGVPSGNQHKVSRVSWKSLVTNAKSHQIHTEAHAAPAPGTVLPPQDEDSFVPQRSLEETDARVAWKACQQLTASEFGKAVGDLCKVRLSGLVVISAIVGYALAPGDFIFTLNNATTCFGLVAGTSLCVASANTFNQWLEVPFDAQMKRTSNRPLVRGVLRPVHALGIGIGAGLVGFTTLYTLTNPLTAALGVGNIFLYAGIYTPMKRTNTLNTWAGAVVGAVPPLMGWTAVTGTMDVGGLLLAGVLFAWQFPHFNALSWNLRADYSRAGYRMMSVVNPTGCRRVALQYAAALIPISVAFSFFGVCDWWLALDATALNLLLTYRSWQFYEDADEPSARRLFMMTLWQLPALLLLFLLHKNRDSKVPESLQSNEQRQLAQQQ